MKFLVFLFLALPVLIYSHDKVEPAERRPDPTANHYTAVAPFNIRQGKPYRIVLRGFNLRNSIRISTTLGGISDTGSELNIVRSARISPSNPKATIIIDTNRIERGDYWLFVEGGFHRENITLRYVNKKYTFSVQFNKAIQRPDDTLRFRIFSTDSETNAVNPTEPNTISILDPRNILVATYANVTFSRGKYENKFKLASTTRLGFWTFRFESANEFIQKEFEVSEYQLPILTGRLLIPNQVPISSNRVPITIEASYTSGGHPVGTAIVEIRRSFGSTDSVVVRNVPINSASTTFEVLIAREIGIATEESFIATLTFQDPLTNARIVDEKFFSLVQNIYSIFIFGSPNFKPGSDYTFTVFLRKFDGTPAPTGTKVHITAENPNTIPGQTLYLGADGRVTSSVFVPEGTTDLQLKATAHEAYDGFIYAFIDHQIGTPYLAIQVQNQPRFDWFSSENIKLYEPVSVELSTVENVESAIVNIVSKGVLLKTFTVWFSNANNLRTATFTFTPNIQYAPFSEIFAYFVTRKGNIVSGQRYISFTNDLPNYLKIRPAENQVAPGENVKFHIESTVNSRVSLVAVDQRVLLLRDDGNFTKESVFSDMYGYGNGFFFAREFSRRPGIRPIRRRRSGIILITNARRGVDDRPFEELARARPGSPRTGEPKAKTKEIREDFRETFLWRDVDIRNPIQDDLGFSDAESRFGIETISEKVPESITKYLIYGVSMNTRNGMGLSDNVPALSIFLSFFLSVELPYSVKRNEVLVQDILIFNFLGHSQTVEVKITKESKFVGVNIAAYGWTETSTSYTKTVNTVVGEHIKVEFALKAKVLGFVPFEVTARGPLAGDGIKKQLRVIHEGVPRTITRALLVALEHSDSRLKEKLKCDLPKSAFKDSTQISASVTGDIFGKALQNLDRLIVFPSGCCEQIASSLFSNIFVYNYLLASDQLTPELKATLEANIAAGIQKLLKCLLENGGFGVFGSGKASTWVTAYIIQHFYSIADVVTIDPNVIERGADFVALQQNADGSFNEVGGIVYSHIQGGSGAGTVALTAFCSIFFSKLIPKYPKYETVRDNSIKYLENKFKEDITIYERGIITYALLVGESSKAKEAYDLFYSERIESSTLTFWRMPDNTFIGSASPRSINNELSAYGLLSVIKCGRESLRSTLKIVRFLVSQSNAFGGFSSSHDTAISFLALEEFAKTYRLDASVDVELTPDVGDEVFVEITHRNALTLETFELDPKVREMTVRATTRSSGLAVVSLICNFYDDPKRVTPSFEAAFSIGRSCRSFFEMKACARHIPKGPSNMAIMIVTMPSGFQGFAFDNPAVSLVETTNQGTEITLYFNSIGNTQICVGINAWRYKVVNDLKPGTIQVYDYYDTSKQGMTSYPVPDLTANCF